MLQSLDTLIALVTYLSICSIFVLVIVQMISAAFSLRGKNLANALALTFQKIDPALAADAHALAQRILSDPLLSDSVNAAKDHDPASDDAQRAMPKLAGDMLAKTAPASKLANAIRPQEVYAALKNLASGTDAQMSAAANSILTKVAANSPKADEITQKLKALAQIAAAVVDPATKAEVLKGVGEASAGIVREIDSAKERFEGLCQSAQDRAEQWFRTHTRGFTIGASIVFACFCQIDGLELFHLMSTSPAAREAMSKASEKLLADTEAAKNESGDQMLAAKVAEAWNSTFPAELKITTDHTETLEQVRARAKEASSEKNLAAAKDAAAKAVTAAGNDAAKKKTAEAQLGSVADLVTSFETKLAAIETVQRSAFTEKQARRIDELKAMSEAAGYPIFPPGRWWRWPGQSTGWSFFNALCHLPGVSLFAALLTLGAPYWFNLLKNLASLKPALAQLIGDEKNASQSARK